ncbi:ELP3 family histone acetyltransferase [Colletotrichum sojae]|uniref:ELP3 family histone acetyltransferase n=1 Tax=Colletotrichum sojae TaxID=2175907 RepID=A0A8H6IW54_9PEZI|nr:ELP3 family histone acetyltransferase [Colletotrichum sojae]
MVTATATVTKARAKADNLPPENERFLRCCADIANALIEDHETPRDPKKPQRDLNLNSMRNKFARKHKLANIPPLTAIIAAIPEHYKKYILPKLIAKPIRTYTPKPPTRMFCIRY